MITVRFPSGVAVQYNDATFMNHSDTGTWTLRDREGGRIIAIIQAHAGVAVEFQQPCRISNASLTTEAVARELASNAKALESLPGSVLRDLKVALRRFNARSWLWS